MAEKPNIFIATPTAREAVTVSYAASLARICYELGRRGFTVGMETVEGHDVANQRDILAAKFLTSGFDRLLFIDGDVGVSPGAILKLYSFDVGLVGIPIPLRDGSDRFTVVAKKMQQAGELIEVDAVGTGIMMVKRETFEAVRTHHQLEHYFVRPNTGPIEGFFNRIKLPDGERYPEDWSFCRRYREAGGNVYAFPFARTDHTGTKRYSGSLAEKMKRATG